MTAAPTPSTSNPKRKRRMWLRLVVLGLALLIVLVAAAPTLVNTGIGAGLIRSQISKSINGQIDLGRLRVGWFGSQSVKNFSIIEPSGRKAVDVDATIDAGLLALLFRRPQPLHITVAGDVAGDVRPDNSLSFSDLFTSPSKSRHPSKPPRAAKPFQLPEIPSIVLHINGLALDLTQQFAGGGGRRVVLDNLTGQVAYIDIDQPITAELHGTTGGAAGPAGGGLPGPKLGSLDVTALATDLFTPQRELNLRKATAKVDVKLRTLPIPLSIPGAGASGTDVPVDVHRLDLSIASDDLTGRIVASLDVEAQLNGYAPSRVKTEAAVSNILTAQGDLTARGATAHVNSQFENLPVLGGPPDMRATVQSLAASIISEDLTKKLELALDGVTHVEGYEPSPVTAHLSIDEPLDPQAKPTIALDRITGSVGGKMIPSPLIQPFLAKTAVDAVREIGPTIDVQASFSAGATRDVLVVASGSKARLEVNAGLVQDGAISGTRLALAATAADPALVQALTNLTVDRPVDVDLRLTSFSLPQRLKPLAHYAAAGALKVAGPVMVQLPASAERRAIPLQVQHLALDFTSPALAQHLDVSGSAMIDGGRIEINERITQLFDAAGKLDLMNALPVGELTLNNIPAATLAQFAPEQKRMIDALVGQALNARVNTAAPEGHLSAKIDASGQSFQATTQIDRPPTAIRVGETHVALSLTPELVAAVQTDRERPIALSKPARATVDVRPFELSATRQEPIRAMVALDDAVLQNVPAMVEAVGVGKFAANVQLTSLSPSLAYAVDGRLTLFRSSVDRAVAKVTFNATTSSGQGVPEIVLNLNDVVVRHVEQMLGQFEGAFSDWTGASGDLVVQARRESGVWHAALQSKLPNISGEFNATADGEMVSLTAKPTTIILNREVLQKRTNPPRETPQPTAGGDQQEGRGEGPQTPWRLAVEADVPLQLAIKQFRFPLAIIQKKAFDPAKTNIELSLSGGPVRIAYVGPEHIKAGLRDLNIALRTKNLASGVEFSLRSKTEAAAVEESGPVASSEAGFLEVTGTVAGLVSQDSTLQTSASKLQMTATAKKVPTAVADAFLDLQGLLVAAVGPQMNARFIADDFSFDSGQLDVRIDTTNGWLEASVRGRENALRTFKDKPIGAELAITPPLRQRLLQKIHPILADVRTTEQPLRVAVPLAVVPGGGDVSKLRADIHITVGKVAFDSGSTTLGLLRLFNQKGKQTIPGEIEPISATIRNGIVKYEKFAVHIDKYTMNYSGEINLVKRTVNLKTEVPLKALGETFRELEPYAEDISVPLVTRGKFGDVKTTIDPDFDLAGAAAKAGFKGALQELLRGKGGSGGGSFLEDLLKRGAKRGTD